MLGKPVSDFTLPSTGNSTFQLSSTRGCTAEGADFRDFYKDFSRAGCEIYGVSRDSLKSHESFKAKMKFPFELLSDADEALCEQFGVMKAKTMKVRGIPRSDHQGERVVAREWRGVKVSGHVQEVLNFVKAL